MVHHSLKLQYLHNDYETNEIVQIIYNAIHHEMSKKKKKIMNKINIYI